MRPGEHDLLSVKQLAAEFGVSVRTIFSHKKQGFPMQSRRATIAEYRAWREMHSGRGREIGVGKV